MATRPASGGSTSRRWPSVHGHDADHPQGSERALPPRAPQPAARRRTFSSGVANRLCRAAGGRWPPKASGSSVCGRRLIPDHSSVIINIGTTTEQVAMALADTGTRGGHQQHQRRQHPAGNAGAEVVIAGGHWCGTPTGASSARRRSISSAQFRVDYAVIGTSGHRRRWNAAGFRFARSESRAGHNGNARETILVADA